MIKILVWDIPARLFHWPFAVSLTAAMAIRFLADDDQPLFENESSGGEKDDDDD